MSLRANAMSAAISEFLESGWPEIASVVSLLREDAGCPPAAGPVCSEFIEGSKSEVVLVVWRGHRALGRQLPRASARG